MRWGRRFRSGRKIPYSHCRRSYGRCSSAPILRNALALAKIHEIDGEALSFAGTIALSLFLAMALMSLRLWELAQLALPMLLLLALQAASGRAVTSFVTFRVMGANYEAAVLVAGQCGFGLGATPTAIANIQAICCALRRGAAGVHPASRSSGRS